MAIPVVPIGVLELPIPAIEDVLAGFEYGPVDDPLVGTMTSDFTEDELGLLPPLVAIGTATFIVPPESVVRAGIMYGALTGSLLATGSCTEQFSPYEWLKNEWQWVEGVANAGFQYGPQTYTDGKASAPSTGVKVRRGNPTQNQIAVAASTVGYETTDQIFTIWSNTLREDPSDEGSDRVYPQQGDMLIACGRTWIIQSVKDTMYDTQYIAYCRLSTRQRQLGIAS